MYTAIVNNVLVNYRLRCWTYKHLTAASPLSLRRSSHVTVGSHVHIVLRYTLRTNIINRPQQWLAVILAAVVLWSTPCLILALPPPSPPRDHTVTTYNDEPATRCRVPSQGARQGLRRSSQTGIRQNMRFYFGPKPRCCALWCISRYRH